MIPVADLALVTDIAVLEKQVQLRDEQVQALRAGMRVLQAILEPLRHKAQNLAAAPVSLKQHIGVPVH